MTPVDVTQGDGPVILGLPHTGTYVPKDILDRLNSRGRELADTDWNIDRLYDGLLTGATTVRATFHRYVIDANRSPSQQSLYPGQNTTGLVPETDFDGNAIWAKGQAPTPQDIAQRCAEFHTPYHVALKRQMLRVQKKHGVAILYDCHSIRGDIPYLFEGTLPDLNIGTNGGTTCDHRIQAAVLRHCTGAKGHSWVLNGRFKGGWTTRHYGQPASGWHAVQMEIAQSAYMTEHAPWTYLQQRAEQVREILGPLLNDVAELAPSLPRPCHAPRQASLSND